MASRKSSKTKKSKSKKPEAQVKRSVRLVVAGKVTVVLALICALGAGFYLGGRTIVRSVVRDRSFRINPVQLRLALPRCVTNEIREELGMQLSYLSEMSIFEPRLPALVARALNNSPWVLRVNKVERLLPNELQLQLEFRRPAGIVQVGNSLFLVDAQGYWLPSRFFKWPYKERPPVIVGRNIDAWPRKGEPWRSPAVRAGALLTQFLMQNSQHLRGIRIAKIDLSNLGHGRQAGQSCVVLVTDSGVQINWGCSPVCAELRGTCSPAGELTDDEKLANLRRILRVRRGLARCAVVDVRFRTPVIVEKKAEEAKR